MSKLLTSHVLPKKHRRKAETVYLSTCPLQTMVWQALLVATDSELRALKIKFAGHHSINLNVAAQRIQPIESIPADGRHSIRRATGDTFSKIAPFLIEHYPL